MAADISFNRGSGGLSINDTGAVSDEVAVVTFEGSRVNVRVESKINGVIRDVDNESYRIGEITRINFNGADGVDKMYVKQLPLNSGVSLSNLSIGFSGGSGDDTFYNDSWARAFADGGLDNDYLTGGYNDDTLSGNFGMDTIVGSLGVDTIDGGLGNDKIYGDYTYISPQGSGDTIFGDGGVDTIEGGAGGDTINGGTENDFIWGDHKGSDSAGTGDTIYGQEGTDTIRGGGGNDDIWGDDRNSRYVAIDYLYGGDGNDTMYGGFGNDVLNGENHHDTLYGDAGRDTLDGGAGDDYLTGGSWSPSANNDSDGEADILRGGTGADTFEIDRATRRTWKIWRWFTETYNRDRAVDFNAGERDKEVNWS